MKKGLLLILLLFSVSFVLAQEVPSNIPGSNAIGNIEIDPQTGTPKAVTGVSDRVSEFRQQNNTFLWKSLGRILADKPVIGPSLFYTEKFFAFFNPLWRYSFGTEFSWSFGFFLHIVLWAVLIFTLYFPVKELLENSLFALITGLIIASLTGSFGFISRSVVIMEPLIKNGVNLIIFILLVGFYVGVYEVIYHNMKKESETEELKRADKSRKAAGNAAKNFLDKFSN